MGARTVEIVAGGGGRVFGATAAERLRRQFGRLGLVEGEAAEIVVRGDHVYGAAALAALAEAGPGVVLTDAAGRAVAARVDGSGREALRAAVAARARDLPDGAAARDAAGLAGTHDRKLRKRAAPVVAPAHDPRAAEAALFAASYKGVTDVVTKRVWPRPALAVTRWCAERGITPNQVTAASALLVAATFLLFWEGWLLTGLVLGWAMTFLDTVDGKLARVTETSSRWGDVFDHGIDLLHPPFWWWAWAVGAGALEGFSGPGALSLGIIVAGYVAQRLEEGWFLARFGIEMHVWRPFDSRFREITARRNPNLLILSAAALVGAPQAGLHLVAVWVAACFLVHLVRIVQAHAAARRGPLVSWLAGP